MSEPMLILTNPQSEQRYRFSINTAAYENLNRSTSYRWAKQDRLNTGPALQFIGAGDDTLTIAGIIYPHFLGGLDQVEQMRNEASKGKPFILISGTGQIVGKYVIESISEEQQIFATAGIPKKINFSLNLRRYAG